MRNYQDHGYTRHLERERKKEPKQELTELDAEQVFKSYPAYQITPEGKITSKNGNLVIDFEKETITIKRDRVKVVLGGIDGISLKDKDGTEFIDNTGVL